MTKSQRNIILLILGIVLILFLTFTPRKNSSYIPLKNRAQRSYIPVVINGHDVLLISGIDTIMLSLENPTPLQEEYIIFVRK